MGNGELTFTDSVQQEFLRRLKANSNYSLRAYARDLDYDASTLSKLLRGKKKVGARVIRRVSRRLGINEEKINRFVYEEKLASARESLSANPFQDLAENTFKIISDWYHFAILELISTKGFRGRPSWIAKRLELSLLRTEKAIARLKRAGLLEITADGKWRETNSDRLTTTGNPNTGDAYRNMQRQLLAKASWAQDNLPVHIRDQSSMTMAIDSKKIPAAKEKIKTFRRELSQLLARDGARDEVYGLTISLFPLTTGGAT